jgi:hypothetical protein
MLIRAVHPMPPTDPNLGFWRSALDGLATWAHSQPDGIPLVLAGDFNASADHPGYRQVADGLVDAHRAVGAGWVRTWPLGRRWLPPFVQIDHIRARGLTVTGAGSEVIAGATALVGRVGAERRRTNSRTNGRTTRTDRTNLPDEPTN